MMLLAILHAGFYKRFNWKDELPKLSLLNKQIFYVHVTGSSCVRWNVRLLADSPHFSVCRL